MNSFFLNVKFWVTLSVAAISFTYIFYDLDYNVIYPSNTALLLTFLPALILTAFILKTTNFLRKDKYVILTRTKLFLVRTIVALSIFTVLSFFCFSFFNTFTLAINNYIPTKSITTENTYKIIDCGKHNGGRFRTIKYSYVHINYKQKEVEIKFPYSYYQNLIGNNFITLTMQSGAVGYDIILKRELNN